MLALRNLAPPSRRGTRARPGAVVLALVTLSALGPTGASAQARPSAEGETPSTPDDVTVEQVTIEGSGGTPLGGAVVSPADGAVRRPGAVVVHDSGPRGWQEYVPLAAELARDGVVTLVYDKRTVGYSVLERDFDLLAADATAAVDLLREQAGVDPDRVGLIGLSEGGWVAPLAAAGSADVAFLVTVGASGLSPARTQAWSYRTWLERAGVSGSLRRTVEVSGTRLMVDAGMFPEGRHDPRDALRRVEQPVLAVWGALDRQVPVAESVAIFEREVAGPLTVAVVADAEHSLELARDDGFGAEGRFVAGFPDLVGEWVRGLSDDDAGAPESRGDVSAPGARGDTRAHPGAAGVSPAITPLGRWEATGAQAVVAIALLGIALVTPLVGSVRRTRPAVARTAGRVLAAGVWVSVLGLVTFLGFIASTGAQDVGPVVLGRPVAWLGLQVAALATAVAGVLVALRWWWARAEVRGRQQVRLSALTVAAVLFVPWAVWWGLLVP